LKRGPVEPDASSEGETDAVASIEKRTTSKGEARWEVRYRVGGREVSRTFKTRTDATNYRRQVEHDELRGASFDPRLGKITLTEWWALWWPSTANLRASTRARDEGYFESLISPTLGDLALTQIDRPALRAWVAELQSRGLAPATIVKAAQIVGKTLRAAVHDGRLPRNPVQGLELPRVERREPQFLTPEQVGALTDAMPEAYRALVPLGAYCGLRLGEMLALRRGRVDLLHRRIEVVATLYEIGGELVENPPKTRAGHRSVPMPRVVADAIVEHLAVVPGGAGDYLFRAPLGGPVRVASWRSRFWTPATRRAGLAPLRAHDLRHTAVALWIAAGASPKEIAARAGHSSVVTVLDRYGHLLPGSEERVTDALDAIAGWVPETRRGAS
jgi:integrase